MGLKYGADDSIRGNCGSHACVGGAQHGPGSFQRTHAGNLQVLSQRPGIPEPGEITDVHQDAGAAATCVTPDALYDFFAENVFVADIGCHPLAGNRHGRLARNPPVEVPQGDAHGVDKPAKASGYEFTEGHKMHFVVAQRHVCGGDGFGGEAAIKSNGAVGIAVAAVDTIMQGHTHQ